MTASNQRRITTGIAFVILVGLFLLIYELAHITIKTNIEKNVAIDIQSVLETQAMVIEHKIQGEFDSLTEIRRMIEDDFDITDARMKDALSILVESRGLCMLALADEQGDVTNYLGESMGNISDREYFQKILRGEESEFLFYLEKPKGADSPRLIFALPITKDGTITGVLFESKEIDEIEKTLFSDNVFSGYVDLFIVEGENRVIVANENLNVFSTLDFSPDSLDREHYYMGSSALRGIDWTLVCIVDKTAPIEEYQTTEKTLLELVAAVLFALGLFFGSCILLNYHLGMHSRKEREWLDFSYKNAMAVLEKLKCAIVEYDVAEDIIESNDLFEELFSCDYLHGHREVINRFEKQHPEFSAHEMENAVEQILTDRKPRTIETYLIVGDRTIWITVFMFPIFDMEEKVSRVLAAVQDVTSNHEKHDEVLNLIRKIPGGIHRCYLSDPIHLEYASDSLVEMLGYTREEYENMLGPDSCYLNCVAPEDQERFVLFVKELAKEEKTDVISYHMIRKDGTQVPVSDTMESKRGADGIMYGYSVLTNEGLYVMKNLLLEKELENTKEILERTRIRISTSQMQPHFLYNALSSIREIVLDDPEYASELIYDFTVHLRACIKSMSNDDLIPFRQEIENVRAYTEIERMRFGDKLKITLDIEEDDFLIIPLGIQPLVENSIRHGIYKRGAKGGCVTVKSFAENGFFVIQIMDDGVGFDLEKVKTDIMAGEKDSTGLLNLIYRFEQLMHASVAISSRIDEGTVVTVRIPKERNEKNENDHR